MCCNLILLPIRQPHGVWGLHYQVQPLNGRVEFSVYFSRDCIAQATDANIFPVPGPLFKVKQCIISIKNTFSEGSSLQKFH